MAITLCKPHTRQQGQITRTFIGDEAHGIRTCVLDIEFPGSSQTFGGLALQTEAIARDYVQDLCATFDVPQLSALVGKDCYALRCFNSFDAHIEGLEAIPSGKRFLHTAWRRKLWPGSASPLEEKIQALQRDITLHERAIHDRRTELAQVADLYQEWQ